MQETLYDNWNEYWMDIQLCTDHCDKCEKPMDVMKSIPVKKENNGYIFVCKTCHKEMV